VINRSGQGRHHEQAGQKGLYTQLPTYPLNVSMAQSKCDIYSHTEMRDTQLTAQIIRLNLLHGTARSSHTMHGNTNDFDTLL
jgi:hypothetical protein